MRLFIDLLSKTCTWVALHRSECAKHGQMESVIFPECPFHRPWRICGCGTWGRGAAFSIGVGPLSYDTAHNWATKTNGINTSTEDPDKQAFSVFRYDLLMWTGSTKWPTDGTVNIKLKKF